MNEQRSFFAAESVPGIGIVTAGGYDGQKIIDTCELYEPSKDSWK